MPSQELYKKSQEVTKTRQDMEAASRTLITALWGNAAANGTGGAGDSGPADTLKAALKTLQDLHPLVRAAFSVCVCIAYLDVKVRRVYVT